MIAFITTLVGIGVAAIALDALFLLVAFFVDVPAVRTLMRRGGLLAAFLVALVAALGTLYFSEIVGIVPCTLCWYQRAVLYPLVAVFAYGYFARDDRVLPWAIGFSLVGLGIALYHVSLPLWTSPLFCDAETALCLIQKIKIFGFLTIPMMSATVFAYLALLSVHSLRPHSTEALYSEGTDTNTYKHYQRSH